MDNTDNTDNNTQTKVRYEWQIKSSLSMHATLVVLEHTYLARARRAQNRKSKMINKKHEEINEFGAL